MKGKGITVRVPDSVYETDRWSRYLWKEQVERSPEVQEVVDKGEQRAFNFPAFAQEVFHRLYADKAKKLDSVKPEHAWAEKAHDELSQLPAFEQLSRRCKGDKFLAGVAATAFSEKALAELPAPEDPLEDPEPMRQQVRGLMAFAQGLGAEQQKHVEHVIAGLREQGKAAVAKARAYAQGLDPSAVRQALRAACVEANQQVDKAVEQLAAFTGWGDEPGRDGTGASVQVKAELSRRIGQSKKLQELAQEAGRLRRVAARKQRSKADHVRDEVSDIELGADIGQLLPSELVKLTDRRLAWEFARKFHERGLLQYRLSGKEQQGRGPIIVCLDSSGSMEGAKEVWSKALALALLQTAVEQRRPCRVLHFDGQVVRIDDWLPGKVDLTELLSSMEFFSGGGTSLEEPLSAALEAIERNAHLKKADVVLVTDGVCHVADDFLQRWTAAKSKHEFTTYAVHIGPPSEICPAVLSQVADKVIGLSDLHQDGDATDAILSI